MNVIKVKVSIDIDNEQQVKCFNAFIAELKSNGGSTAVVEAPVKDIKTNVEKAVTETAKTVQTTTASTTTESAPATTATPTGSKKLDAIRKLIAEKAGQHRVAMKAKLAEFGAATATDLVVDKYNEFHDFLEKL